jgi:diguanylate cyclase (GGDEF)-like protein
MSVSLVVAAGLALQASQAAAHRGVAQRWVAKAGLSADFAGTYVAQLTSREQRVAASTLTGTHPGAAFDADVRGFGFAAAALLDGDGRDIAIVPHDPRLVGTQIGAKYALLTVALRGHVAVSNIVLSAVKATPVVGFAVPFRTPQGRRVFSGGYPISDTPLAAYLNDATSLQGARLYLTDSKGAILATNGKNTRGAQTLTQRAPSLGRAAATSLGGSYRSTSGSYTFAKATVPGTPWTLVITAPTSLLFAATDGSARWLPWLILACLSLLIGVVGCLAIRLLEGRRRLADANRLLLAIARTDGLTSLSTRAHLTDQLETLLAEASPHDVPLCVLMIDVDHFKQLNDNYGHQAGDEALRHIANRLLAAVREGDLIARWGGEEFLAVLPDTAVEEGLEVADRLCRLIAADPIEIGAGGDLVTIQVSVGVAQAAGDGIDALVHRADLGLYRAKEAGRNTARAAGAAPVTDRVHVLAQQP